MIGSQILEQEIPQGFQLNVSGIQNVVIQSELSYIIVVRNVDIVELGFVWLPGGTVLVPSQ
jgi:hypothetical protein